MTELEATREQLEQELFTAKQNIDELQATHLKVLELCACVCMCVCACVCVCVVSVCVCVHVLYTTQESIVSVILCVIIIYSYNNHMMKSLKGNLLSLIIIT